MLLNLIRLVIQDAADLARIEELFNPAAPLMAEREERYIEELLRQCNVADLPGLYHVATGGRARLYPRGLANLGEVFVYLQDSNTRPGHLAPHLRLAAHVCRDLAHRETPIPPGLLMKLRQWLTQQCDELRDQGDSRAAHELNLLLHETPPFQTRNDFPISLIVEINQLPVSNDDRDLHHVSHWRQFDHTRWEPVRGEERELPLTDVIGYVLDLIKDADSGWGYGAKGPLLLEISLPLELINWDVDQWPQQAEGDLLSRKLGLDYEIVLRSDVRLRPRHKHRPWFERWDYLVLGEGEVHLIPLEEPTNLGGLHTQLRAADHAVACMLTTPPDREPGRSQLEIAIDAGLPSVLWCRDTENNDAFRAAVDAVIQPAEIKRLPTSIRHLRSSHAHTCGNIALLWDDPNHMIPDAGFLRTPSR